MPTYEYECPDCGHRFEEMQKITADPLKDCPSCGGSNVRRLVSASAFHLKGSGWYKTDYSSSSSTSEDSGSSAANSSGGNSDKSSDKSSNSKNDSKKQTSTSSSTSSGSSSD